MLNVTVGEHASQMMLETLTLQTRVINWSVSNVPLAPKKGKKQYIIVDYVAFF